VTKARAIHGEDAIPLGQWRKHSVDLKILQHRAVAAGT
jgi:hypothetical protein